VPEVSLFFCYLLRCKVQVQKVKVLLSILFQSPGFANWQIFFQSGELAEVMGGINIWEYFYFLTPGLFTYEIRPSKNMSTDISHILDLCTLAHS